MEHEERTSLVRIAIRAQALLDRLDTITTEAFSQGGEREEREALRAALATTPVRCEACGAGMTAAEQAASDVRDYVNCESCSTSRF